MSYKKTTKKTTIFTCEKCNFKCSKKQDYNRHILTRKHEMITNDYKKTPKNSKLYNCECGKMYSHRQGLYAHKKKCTLVIENNCDEKINDEIDNNKLIIEDNNVDYKEMFLEMMKQNQELQKTVVEQQKQYTETINEIIPKIGNNNTTNTTNNNNQFNLHFFLNEQCKDALNITDFMKSIQVNMNDLIQTGKLGYVDGMSRIFVNALKDMDVTERPIHCTDIKRETVYIKDQDKWEKDKDNKDKLKKTIRTIEKKNLKMLPKWQEENPEYRNLESKKSNEFMELSITALGGQDDKDKSEKKIMKNILKEVILEKKSQ
jgi:hypothetical protein